MSDWPELSVERDHDTLAILTSPPRCSARSASRTRLDQSRLARCATAARQRAGDSAHRGGRRPHLHTGARSMPPRNHPWASDRSREEVPLNAGSVGALHSRLVAMLDRHGLPSTFDGLPNEIEIRSRSPKTRRRVITAATPRSDSVRRSRPSCRHSRRSAQVSAARPARRISGGAVRSGCEPLSRDERRRRTRAECRACPIASRAKPIATRWQAAASGRGGHRGRPFFYSYIYPEPDGYRAAKVAHGHFDESFGEYVLPYAESSRCGRSGANARRVPAVCPGCRPSQMGSCRARAEARRA